MESLRDIRDRMKDRDATPSLLRAAMMAPANGNAEAAFTALYQSDPKLMAQLLAGICWWPTRFSLAELLTMCRDHQARNREGSLRSIQLKAARAVLGRMIDREAQAAAEGHVGADRYRCATCGAEALHDLPDCPRPTPRDCDVLCERITDTEKRNAA